MFGFSRLKDIKSCTELRNCSWYGSYASTAADSKHLIKSQGRKVIIYQYYKRICLIVRGIWGSKILTLLNKKGLGLVITDSTSFKCSAEKNIMECNGT